MVLVDGSTDLTNVTTDILPDTTNVRNIGSTSKIFRNIYATYINGNASSATKLQTARTINGAAFDGSANINITANPTANQLTDEDLNTIKTSTSTGFYFGVGNNSVTNKPSNVDWFGLIVSKIAGQYILQELHTGSENGAKYYTRVWNNSTWSD